MNSGHPEDRDDHPEAADCHGDHLFDVRNDRLEGLFHHPFLPHMAHRVLRERVRVQLLALHDDELVVLDGSQRPWLWLPLLKEPGRPQEISLLGRLFGLVLLNGMLVLTFTDS